MQDLCMPHEDIFQNQIQQKALPTRSGKTGRHARARCTSPVLRVIQDRLTAMILYAAPSQSTKSYTAGRTRSGKTGRHARARWTSPVLRL
jgi:hypothetical protein